MVFCSKCGYENADDAKYCEKCGQSLQKGINKRNTTNKETNKSNGMSIGVKALIIVCVILIAGIGVTAGMLLQKPAASAANNSGQYSAPTTSSTDQVYQPTWHQVATYTGPGGVNGTFSIQGNQFKVTMSAVPTINYDVNSLDVGIGSGNYLIASGTLSWTADENPTQKESVIPVSQGQGIYDIEIDPTNIRSYTVTVWDYY